MNRQFTIQTGILSRFSIQCIVNRDGPKTDIDRHFEAVVTVTQISKLRNERMPPWWDWINWDHWIFYHWTLHLLLDWILYLLSWLSPLWWGQFIGNWKGHPCARTCLCPADHSDGRDARYRGGHHRGRGHGTGPPFDTSWIVLPFGIGMWILFFFGIGRILGIF